MSYILEKKSAPGAARWVQRSDFYSLSFPVSPTNTINEYFFAPYDLTLKEVNAYCHSGAASAAGTYLLFVSDETASNNLLSAPGGFDLEAPSLPAATLTAVGLTGTTANLSMPKGSVIKIQAASDNADLVAEGVYVQLIFGAQ
tara:strand:+ start:7444 stop:7872 length:429 start_codon:yes stop_codon:yes gene_type:complete